MTFNEYIKNVRSPENWTAEFFAETDQFFIDHLNAIRDTLVKDGLWNQFDVARCEWKRPGQVQAIESAQRKAVPDKGKFRTTKTASSAVAPETGGDCQNIGLATNSKGAVMQTIGNCITAISNDSCLKEMFQYNEMSGNIEVSGAWWKRSTVNLSDNDVNNIRLYLEQNYGLAHEKNIPRAIDIIAHERAYHPVREFLTGLKWDGVKRIENILPRYLGAEKSEYTAEAMKLFMLGAISRVFKPGEKFELMLCVVENRQGGGKSTLARFLAICDEWFTDDIKNLDDDLIYRKLAGHWIIEFSEMLATSNTKTVEGIKSFLSRQKDTYKVPYEKYPKDYPRQCVFFGTTNNIDFLPSDKTGNRRFVPVMVNSARAEAHPLKDEAETRAYIKQAWAEAMEIYRSGEYSLTFPEELQETLEEVQREFTPEDPKIGVIQYWLDNCQYKSVCSLMIYREALQNEYQEPRPWELREISSIMNRSIIGWKKHPTTDSKVRFHGYGKQRAWDRLSPEPASPDRFMDVGEKSEQLEFPFPP